MDVFTMQRMAFNGQEMAEEPPRSEYTGRTIRDPKDPEFLEPERYTFELMSESLVVPWE